MLIEDLVPTEKSFRIKLAFCNNYLIFRILIQKYLRRSRLVVGLNELDLSQDKRRDCMMAFTFELFNLIP